MSRTRILRRLAAITAAAVGAAFALTSATIAARATTPQVSQHAPAQAPLGHRRPLHPHRTGYWFITDTLGSTGHPLAFSISGSK